MDHKSFDRKRIAEGYAKDRPYLHKQVIDILQKDMGINSPFRNGLDVGCGAGLSTKALKRICGRVTGVDSSPEMIRVCREIYGKDRGETEYRFLCCRAEELKETDAVYDIVSAAGAVNWIDEKSFLPALKGIMKPESLLFIYDFWITGKMRDNEKYTEWYETAYLRKFPKPPRSERIWTQEELPDYFRMIKQVTYELVYRFDLETFIRFMLIQSNVNERIEKNGIKEDDAAAWFYDSLAPVWGTGNRELVFAGYSWYLKLMKS